MEKDNEKCSSELLEAIEEAKQLEADPNTKRYTNMNEMWADLDKWLTPLFRRSANPMHLAAHLN